VALIDSLLVRVYYTLSKKVKELCGHLQEWRSVRGGELTVLGLVKVHTLSFAGVFDTSTRLNRQIIVVFQIWG
jgi:hypothetical protein